MWHFVTYVSPPFSPPTNYFCKLRQSQRIPRSSRLHAHHHHHHRAHTLGSIACRCCTICIYIYAYSIHEGTTSRFVDSRSIWTRAHNIIIATGVLAVTALRRAICGCHTVTQSPCSCNLRSKMQRLLLAKCVYDASNVRCRSVEHSRRKFISHFDQHANALSFSFIELTVTSYTHVMLCTRSHAEHI